MFENFPSPVCSTYGESVLRRVVMKRNLSLFLTMLHRRNRFASTQEPVMDYTGSRPQNSVTITFFWYNLAINGQMVSYKNEFTRLDFSQQPK